MRAFVCSLVGALLVTSAAAAPITYSLTATADGTLNGVAFDEANLTIFAEGDTENVNSFLGAFTNSVSTTVTIAGQTITVLGDPRAVSNGFSGNIGFSVFGSPGGPILFLNTSTAADFDLRSSFEAFSATNSNFGFSLTETTGGQLRFDLVTDLTFTADLVDAVPAPPVIGLFGIGMLALCLRRRRTA